MSNKRDLEIKRELLKIVPNSCLFCGYNMIDHKGNTLLECAHIRNFSEGKQYDDIHNVILLCPNHHTEYDHDLIDFTPDGIIHHRDQNNTLNGVKVQYDIRYVYPGYIIYHNSNSFLNKLNKNSHSQ